MIKSQESPHINIYRISKVLANNDYLAVDQHHQNFILAHLLPIHRPLISSLQVVFTSFLQHGSLFIFPKEKVNLESETFAVFEVSQHRLQWVSDMRFESSSCYKNILPFVMQMISNVLSPLLWVQLKDISRCINLKNLWVIDGKISLLMIPRGHQVLPRTEQKRSIKKQCPITKVVLKDRGTIRLFGLILWQILSSTLEKPSSEGEIKNKLKSIIQKMVLKEISYEDIVTQLQLLMIPQRYKPHRVTLPFPRKRGSLFSKPKIRSLSEVSPSPQRRILHFKTPLKKDNRSRSIEINSLYRSEGVREVKERRNKTIEIGEPRETFKKGRWFMSLRSKGRSSGKVNGSDSLLKNILKCRTKNYSETSQIKSVQKQVPRKIEEVTKNMKQFDLFELPKRLYNPKDTVSNQAAFESKVLRKALKNQSLNFKNTAKNSLPTKQLNAPSQIQKSPQKVYQNQSQTPAPLADSTSTVFKNYIQQKSLNDIPEKIEEVILFEYKSTFSKKETDPLPKPHSNHYVHPQKIKRIKESRPEMYQLNEGQIQTLIFKKQTPRKSPSMVQEPLKRNLFSETDHIDSPKKQSFEKSFKKKKLILPDLGQEILRVNESVKEYIMFINILGDICVFCVNNRKQFCQFNWRKSVFFLYERFDLERKKLLESLQQKVPPLTRTKQDFSGNILESWHLDNHKTTLRDQVTQENINIASTYGHFSKKIQQDPQFEAFGKKLDLNREKMNKQVRTSISKYAVGYVINQYDEAVQRKYTSSFIWDYFWKCFFGLRILAELDSVQVTLPRVEIQEYQKGRKEEWKSQEWAESLYKGYFGGQDE